MQARSLLERFVELTYSHRYAWALDQWFAAAPLKNGRLRMNPTAIAAMISAPEVHGTNAWETNMRKRYQKGSLKAVNGKWLFQYYDLQGKKRKERFGSVKVITKSEAQLKADAILVPINATGRTSSDMAFDEFVEHVFFTKYRRKWKNSTRGTTEDRINRHLSKRFKSVALTHINDEQLQEVLEEKTKEGFSKNTVNHLRWDMKHIFRRAVSIGVLKANPAEELFTPRECTNNKVRVMTLEEVALGLTVLPLRERVIYKLAVIAGMRPGEIVGLKRKNIQGIAADIRQRIYKGEVDTPKSAKSVREAALGESLIADLQQWLQEAPDLGPDGWLFSSQNMKTPISRDNLLTRQLHPRLDTVGLGWVNFLVLRKTHSTLMRERGVDPKVTADQQGHNVDVNLNVYSTTSLEERKKAVDRVDADIVAKQSQIEPGSNKSELTN
jgi:integrase